MDNDQEKDPGKIKRYAIWAVFLIVISGLAMFFGPPETVGPFFELLKDVITSLVI